MFGFLSFFFLFLTLSVHFIISLKKIKMLKKTWRRNKKIEFLKIYHRLISIGLFFPFTRTLCILRKNVTGNEKSEVSPNQETVLLSGKWVTGPVGQTCSFSAFLQLLGQGDNANPSVWYPGGQNNKNLKKVCLCFVSVARCHGTPQELAPESSPNTSKHNTHDTHKHIKTFTAAALFIIA